MGSDNGKSSRPSGSTRRKNTKHSERPPPPPDDARSVGSQSTEAAVSMSSRSSVKSSVKHGRDNVSVASSQSSAPIVTAKASYTDMAGKRDKRRHGRKPEKSSGCGRRSFLGLTVMIVWVLFYLARSFNVDSVASFRDSVASLRGGASMNSNEQQVENEGGEADGADEKADTAKEKEDPDADLASLASGAGNNLWEGLLDATTDSDGNSTSSSSTNETSDALSTSNTASSTNKATDGTSASETSLSNNEATQDTSASGIASSTSDAAMSTMESSNAEANEAALSEASALLSGGNSASDLTARSQSLDDSQTTDNAQQLDSQLLPDTQMAEMNAGVQETIQPDGSDRTTSSDLIDGQSTQESTNPQQLTSQGEQALAGQLQETLDVQQQPLVSQVQGYASNGPNGQLSQDSTAHYEANDVQQQLDGVTAENPEGQQMGGDQMATGMQEGTGLETGQVLQSGSLDSETQDINQLAANDAGSQMALQSSDVKQGMLRGSKELQPDGMQQQHEGMRSNDISSQNGGNGMIGQSNNVGDGSMEQQQLQQQQPPKEGMVSNDQQFMVVDNKMLSHGGNSASSGSAGSSVQSSQGSRMMANSNLGDGSISEQQSDGNQMEPNVSQQRVDNRQILTNQVSQGRRRLQEVEQPQSPYENMNPTALAEYVTNHAQYRNLVNFDEDLPFDQSSQVPYLFHIHKSGGSSMKHMITCMGLTQTRRGSAENCNDQANYIHVCPLVWGTAVNADASSPLGIERIKRLGLLDLNVPKLVVTTSRFYEALNILTPQHRGRLFVILRDPVERAISKYYYTKFATWERNYNPAIANMTLMEYAQSKHCYDNWVTRRLIHKMNPDAVLTAGDLRLAKEILKQKALILLTDNLAQSSHRMAQYFGWEMDGNERWCVDKYARTEPVNQNPHPIPHKDSPEWASIRDKNQLDVELYRYAMSIYHDQQGPFLSQKFGPLQLSAAVDPEMNQNATPDEE